MRTFNPNGPSRTVGWERGSCGWSEWLTEEKIYLDDRMYQVWV